MTTAGWLTKRLDAHGSFDRGMAILTHPSLPGLRVLVTHDRATLHNMRGDYLDDWNDSYLKSPPESHISRANLGAVK